jgi:alkylation response protein AidB-like acyl-CoA dehydrogenase
MIEETIRETADECDDYLLDFLTHKVNPGAAERDRTGTHLSRELLREAIDRGLFQHALPKELGGSGAEPLRWGLTLEHIGYRCTDLSFPLLAFYVAGLAYHLHETGRSDLIDTYARPAARGEKLVGFAFTESTDHYSFKSRIQRDGDRITVSARKEIVIGAGFFDAFVTYLTDPGGGQVAVIVHRDDPGVTITPVDAAGYRAAGFARIDVRDAVLPESRVIETDGLYHAQHLINSQAPFLVAGPAGRLRAVLHDCARRLNKTVRHGLPLADYLNVQSLMGRMYADVERCRTALHHALHRMASGAADPLWDEVCWLAKYTVGNLGVPIITNAQRLVGTVGFLRDTGYERCLRDMSGILAGGNPQEKVEVDLGAAVLRSMVDKEAMP